MQSKFEEKTYENYFNTELDRRTQIYFPLGQVQEGFLGFDSAGFSNNRSLFRMLGHPFSHFPYFAGAPLSEIEHFMGRIISELPIFKVNLLFQYKRPEYIKLSSGSEWAHWYIPYFRYHIYKEQQQLLMLIHRQFGDRVLSLYAAPAIFDINELVQKKIANQIIESSNFQQCYMLDGHHRNTYIEAGAHSVACSEPKRIEKIDLISLLTQFEDTISKQENNSQFIINFRQDITNLMYESSYYSKSFKALLDPFSRYERYPLTYSFLVMHNFKLLTGIQWLIKT